MLKQTQVISRVQAAFDEALSSGDLLFFPSSVYPHLDSASGLQVKDLSYVINSEPYQKNEPCHFAV